jgi:pyroglutamyl-peptidase
MKLLVTAFGPFGGRTRNASSLALAELKHRLPWLNTWVFPVDSVIAPLRLARALRQVKPDAVILLGEAGGSKTIRLETTAWNEMDFRIPDIAGRQPQGRPIAEGAADSLRSTLPLVSIHECLLDAGYPVSYSDDPGRYLCNQLFYQILRRTSVPAGFIHLPYGGELPTRRAADALELAIGKIRCGFAGRAALTRR